MLLLVQLIIPHTTPQDTVQHKNELQFSNAHTSLASDLLRKSTSNCQRARLGAKLSMRDAHPLLSFPPLAETSTQVYRTLREQGWGEPMREKVKQ